MSQHPSEQVRAKLHEIAYAFNTRKLSPEERISAVKELLRHDPPLSLRAIIMPGMVYLMDGSTCFASVEGKNLEITGIFPENRANFPIGEIKSVSIIPAFGHRDLYALKISIMRKQR